MAVDDFAVGFYEAKEHRLLAKYSLDWGGMFICTIWSLILMSVSGVNHILSCKDLSKSFDFYTNILGLTPLVRWSVGLFFLREIYGFAFL